MKRNFILAFSLLLCCFIFLNCKTTAAKEKDNVSLEKPSVTVKGKVTVKGNEPHTYLVIIAEDKTEYTIVGDLKEKIRKDYQQKILVVKGVVVKESNTPLIPPELEVLEIVEQVTQ